MIKMGSFLANNLSKAMEKAPPHLSRRMARGRGLLNAAGSVLDVGDNALGTAFNAAFRPGHPALASAVGVPAEAAYSLFKKSPVAMKLTAAGVPAYFIARDNTAKNNIEPLLSSAIEEGREVYANDEEFLKKKEAESEKIAINLDGLMQALHGVSAGLGEGTSAISKGVQAMHGAGPAAGEMAKGFNALREMSGPGADAFRQAIPRLGMGMAIGGGIAGLGGLAVNALKPLGHGIGDTMGYQLNRSQNNLFDRVRGDETAATSFFSTMGSETAKNISGLLRDVASKALGVLSANTGGDQMVQTMMESDDILSRASPEQILNAYHTMSKFAPTLAQDENAVRSFLREAVMAGSGPDYASISNLAKAEESIRKALNPGFNKH